MRFPPAFLDELRSRLRISEVVGRRVQLKNKGGGELTGLCPFHNEKTPSFTVSDRKGFYHCFGCGAHGSVFDFIVETEGKHFADVVAELAALAGMQLPKPDKAEEERYERMATLYDVTEAAAAWFSEQLHTTAGKAARDYLVKRGITEETQKTFRLGYAPEGFETMKAAMLARGITERQLVDTGLIIEKDESRITNHESRTYDRFRGRLMFPIADHKGRVIAFGGRILGDGEPKYLNSPETELFHKGKVLYGLHLARERAFKKNAIVAVEGYMDVIALHQAGITNAVAPLGTALTEQHLQMLWKIAKEPVICLDGDKAGQRAMRRVAEAALPHLEPSLSLRFAVVSQGKDPDEVIKNHGVAAMRDMLMRATPLADALWEMQLDTHPTKTPEQKAAFEHDLLRQVSAIRNTQVQHYYRDYYKDKLWQMRRQKATQPAISSGLKSTASAMTASPLERYEANLVATILNHPSLLEDVEMEEHFMHLAFNSPAMGSIRDAILETENDAAALENHPAAHHVKALEANRYLDSFTRPDAPPDQARSGWNYTLAAWHLLQVEAEYRESITNLSDSAPGQVMALQQQVEAQKKLVEQEKLAYEAALDD